MYNRYIKNAKEIDMRIKAQLFETIEGSDDPRVIQGGGGDCWKLTNTIIGTRKRIDTYIKAYYNRYGEKLIVRIIK